MRRSEAASRTAVDDILRYAIAIGATLVLLLPAARGSHEAVGWLPLWLLGMPLSAWAILRWSRAGAAGSAARVLPATRRRRGDVQARRRRGAAVKPALSRAA